MRLLVLFVLVPILELWVIGEVQGVVGLPLTLVILFGDGIVGAWLVRREGRRAWEAFRQAVSEVRWPGDEVAQGALVVFGGALLLTPGFITDVVGLAAVLPPTRAVIAAQLRARMRPVDVGGLGADGSRRQGRHAAGERGRVLDVEVLSVEPDDTDPDPDERRADP